MTNTSSNFNMVESTGKDPKDPTDIKEMFINMLNLANILITEKDVEYDIGQLELMERWSEKDDREKI